MSLLPEAHSVTWKGMTLGITVWQVCDYLEAIWPSETVETRADFLLSHKKKTHLYCKASQYVNDIKACAIFLRMSVSIKCRLCKIFFSLSFCRWGRGGV